jgi:hypothetical protein
MPKKLPEIGEYWWAFPPDGGDAEPVEILRVFPTGNHALLVLGRSEHAYSSEWILRRLIAGRPHR